jgi:hypothetical protein
MFSVEFRIKRVVFWEREIFISQTSSPKITKSSYISTTLNDNLKLLNAVYTEHGIIVNFDNLKRKKKSKTTL